MPLYAIPVTWWMRNETSISTYLHESVCEQGEHRAVKPSAAIIDRQSDRATEANGERSYDVGNTDYGAQLLHCGRYTGFAAARGRLSCGAPGPGWSLHRSCSVWRTASPGCTLTCSEAMVYRAPLIAMLQRLAKIRNSQAGSE